MDDGDMPGSPAASRTRIWPAVVATALMAAVLGVVGALVVRSLDQDEDPTRGPAAQVAQSTSASVRLEPVGYANPEPFTESVLNIDPTELGQLGLTPPGEVRGGSVAGDTQLLYGSRGERPVCDVARLASLLTSDEQLASSWAAAAGVAPAEVEATVMGLTPVVLTTDTAVTNHTYRNGSPSAYQAVLQAGTPIMIDSSGAPRAQCSCGNPLRAPDTDPATDDAAPEFEGERWDSFDPDAVVRVDATSAASERLTTVDIDTSAPTDVAVGGLVSLDGILAVGDDGVDIVADDGTVTRVVDQPVEAVFDDGDGGLVYTLARSDADPDGYDDGPPDDPSQAVIWHLPAGATTATELVGIEAAGVWNRLLGVGRLGERTLVVFAPLVSERVYESASAPTGPVVALDLETSERTVLLEDGIGWETDVDSVSFGGDRLAMQVGYAMPDWLLFGPDLQPVPNACSELGDSSEERFEFIDDNCPWAGALDEKGHLVFFGSALADEMVVGIDETIERLDLSAGTFAPPVTADFAADTQETSSMVTQAAQGRVAALFVLESDPSGRVLDAANGTFVALPDDMMGSTRSVWILSAPLTRPLAGPSQEESDDEQTTRPPEVDVLNLQLPAGVCPTGDEQGSPPIELVDGAAQTGDDPVADDFVSLSASPEGSTWVDLDGDGTEELVLSIICNWGGSGWANSVVALEVAPDGATALAAAPLEEYGRGTRSADRLGTDEAGVLVITGGEWTDTDALCCASSSFTDRWTLGEGGWSRR